MLLLQLNKELRLVSPFSWIVLTQFCLLADRRLLIVCLPSRKRQININIGKAASVQRSKIIVFSSLICYYSSRIIELKMMFDCLPLLPFKCVQVSELDLAAHAYPLHPPPKEQ